MSNEMNIGDTVAELTRLQEAGVLLTSRSLQVGWMERLGRLQIAGGAGLTSAY